MQGDFKLNIEPNHTTLAGHDFEHDIYISADYGFLGSVDANTGDTLLGWDTDQFLTNHYKSSLVMLKLVEIGGVVGGLNFDCKVRRESTDLEDLIIAHVNAMDVYAQGLLVADAIIKDGRLQQLKDQRYISWKQQEELSLVQCEQKLLGTEFTENVKSGKQELFESIFNQVLANVEYD